MPYRRDAGIAGGGLARRRRGDDGGVGGFLTGDGGKLGHVAVAQSDDDGVFSQPSQQSQQTQPAPAITGQS